MMNKINSSILLVIVLTVCLHLVSFAQKRKKKKDIIADTTEQESFILQPKRIEFEVGSHDEDFFVISAEEKGLLVVKQTRNRAEKGFLWELYLVDSLLTITWNSIISVDYGSSFIGYDYSQGNFFLLYSKSDYIAEKLDVIKVNLKTGASKLHKLKLTIPLEIDEFEVVHNTLIFGGYSNLKPVITIYEFEKNRPTVMPGFYNPKSSIIDVRTDDRTNNFTVVLSERLPNKSITISLKTFTENGALVHTEVLETEYEKSLLDGLSTSFDNGTQYISGTYAKRKSEFSNGLYLAKLELGSQQFIKYYDYTELENFFSYMSAKRESRVKEKIERKKVKGQKVKFNYRLLVNEIIERKNEYILIGEAYYPKYSSYGNGALHAANYSEGGDDALANSSFIGYKYTHAVVVGFSKKGEVLWDNSFEINDLLSYSLKPNVEVSVEKDRIVLLYVYENVIRAKIIQGNEILEGKSFDPIELHFKSDEVRDHSKETEGIAKWYENNFYTYGIQSIKNLKDENVKLNRRVFYINKIQYQ